MKNTHLLLAILLLSAISLAVAARSVQDDHYHHIHHQYHINHINHFHHIHKKSHDYIHVDLPSVATTVTVPSAAQTCGNTTLPAFCLAALMPLTASVQLPTLPVMAKLVVEATMVQTKAIAKAPERLMNEVCKKSYGTAVEGLEEILVALKKENTYDCNVYYNRLMGNYDACMKELMNVKGGSELVKQDQTLREMSGVFLNMIKSYRPL